MTHWTATAIASDVRRGARTARAVVEESLGRIERINPRLNAFSVVRTEQVRAEADAVDAALARGADPGPLAGVPVAVKEEYDVAGDVTTLGGLGNSTPRAADCEVVRRLRAAGAVVVGRTTMPEFGQFPIGQSEYHGTTLNPWDPHRSPGGSSAGSGVAVATGAVPVAMGADGGGSVRIPASACGVLGLKPTRGRISPAPLAEHWYGLATFGVLSRTAEDAAVVLGVVSGNVPGDTWTLPAPERPFTEAVQRATRPMRILAATNPVLRGATAPGVSNALDDLTERLRTLGHDVRCARVSWPDPTAAFLPLYLAGIHQEADQVEHPELLTAHTRRTARLGAAVTPRMVAAAQREAERCARVLDAAFASADLIMLPTLTDPPIGATDFTARGWLSSLLRSSGIIGNTALLNVTGHPGVSVPAGLADGVPVGAQFVARRRREDLLLAVAAQLDRHPRDRAK